MKILVTGGAGFIGSHIAEAYLAEGHDVCVVDDLSSGFEHNVPAGARFHKADIRSAAELDRIFAAEKPEVVNHQAARANVRESFEMPVVYADVNVCGSVNLLESCKKHGVRKVIYASTGGAVYGEPNEVPVPETHPINPLDPYGASKHHVEHYLHLYRANFGIDYTVLRYPNVFGPRQNPHGEAGVVAIFAAQMLTGSKQPLINGDGDQQRDFVHGADVARASVLSLEKGGGEIFNIGRGQGTSVNTIFALLAELTGYGKPAQHGPAKKGEVSRIFLNADKARRMLGWEPRISLRDALSSTVEFFRPAQVKG
jgi:UDP-glucose 4-epimerase